MRKSNKSDKSELKTEEGVCQEAGTTSADGVITDSENETEHARMSREIAELNDKLLRLRAEYENFRRRTFKDIATARSTAVHDTVVPFLNLFDTVSMAISSAVDSDNIDAIRQGLQMIMNEYVRTIGDIGISRFDATGTDFNPELHDAVAQEPSAEVPEGKVISQWNCGYKLGEKLLRPARVVVSAGTEKN